MIVIALALVFALVIVPHRRHAMLAMSLLLTLTACKDEQPDESTNLEPSPPPAPESPSPPEPPERDENESAEGPRRIDVGNEVEDTIGFPGVDAEVGYETDWYVFEGVEGQTVTFRVEATADSRLRPMISVLIPGDGPRDEWEQVGARRAAVDEPSVALTVTLKSAGARLVAVDDARNVVEDGEAAENPVGGEAFGYRLIVEPAQGR